VIVLLLACRDPAFDPVRGALAAYDRGRVALDEGRVDEAATAFAEARAHDASSPLLMLWEGKALAARGDLPAAEARASEAIAREPRLGLAWYQRAAWRARMGQLDAAASDLTAAFQLGATSPLEAAADPDFSAHLGNPALAGILPPTPVLLDARGPEGAVFVGSEVELVLSVAAAPPLAYGLRREGTDPACLRLDRVVEERHAEAHAVVSVLHLRARATRACAGAIGPFRADSSMPVQATSVSDALSLRVEAPQSFAGGQVATFPSTIPVPSVLADPDGAWATGRLGDWVYAIGRADQMATLDGAAPELGLELREESTTRAAGGAWRREGRSTIQVDGRDLVVE